MKGSQIAVSVDGGLGFPVSDADEYRQPGLFGLFVIHKSTIAAETVRQAVFEEIRRVAEGGVSPDELDRVKTKFRSDFIVEGQTTLGRAERLLRAALLDGSPEAAGTELDRFMAVSPADVQKAAGRYLTEETSNTFEVRPRGKAQ